MKIALLFICINEPYWPFLKDVVEDAKKHFLPGHQVDYYCWSDMPQEMNPIVNVFPTDPVVWPMGTLFRYHLFLQQEELLKDYDYIFYCDVDMRIVDTITDEILGDGLTAALHPMYAFRTGLRFPLEPNKESAAYIKVPKYYYAGGFQGGKAGPFIESWKAMKKTIDYDFARNYVAIWNDESHWNRYLLDHEPAVICTPSYIYPDSLIDTYYKPIWGVAYPPKIITLTKKFSVSKEGGEAVNAVVSDFAKLQQP